MAYYLFIDVIARLFALDFAWIASFVLGNTFWVFAFAAVTFIFFEGKNFLLGFIMLVANVWASIDIATATGWVIMGAGFLTLYYITRIMLVAWVESDKELNKYLIIFLNVQFFGLWILFNVFLK